MKQLTDKELMKFRELLNDTDVDVYAVTTKNNILVGNVVLYSNGKSQNYVSFTLFCNNMSICTQGKTSDIGGGWDLNLAMAFEQAVINMINKLNAEFNQEMTWPDKEAIERIQNIDIPAMCDEHSGVFLFREIGLKVRYMMNCLNQ